MPRDYAHPTASTRGRPAIVLVAPLLSCSGCMWSNHHPCPDDGIVRDNVRYANDAYYDADGLIFGVTGDTPLSECTEIEGKIILAGEVSDFSDFDNSVISPAVCMSTHLTGHQGASRIRPDDARAWGARCEEVVGAGHIHCSEAECPSA